VLTRPQTSPQIIDRQPGRAGELVLRENDGHHELISNGVFLMDTRDGRSERELVRRALGATDGHGGQSAGKHVLIAGLGVGFSLVEALSATTPDGDVEVARVVVLEWEPAVVAWHRSILGPRTGGAVHDPRVRCRIEDIVAWLRRPATDVFDAVCLDVDNGPDWTVAPGNAWLYSDEGLAALHDRIDPGGALTVWASDRSAAFEQRLGHRFGAVRTFAVPVARGAPDIIYLARR
jgi:spermidine synthase